MPERELELDPEHTALVVIDLQKGIVGMPAAPYDPASVVAKSAAIAEACRARGAFVVLVHVGPSADGRDGLHPVVDQPTPWPSPPPGWDEIVPELGPRDSDHVVRKRQRGAFYGTDLDLQLRRGGESRRSSSAASRPTSGWRARPATPTSVDTSRSSSRTRVRREWPRTMPSSSGRSSLASGVSARPTK
jgi:hypothetical protein